jgi:hypothetical protein
MKFCCCSPISGQQKHGEIMARKLSHEMEDENYHMVITDKTSKNYILPLIL